MVQLTAEESKHKHIKEMGTALGTQFSELWQQVAYLHFKWQEFIELFGTKPTRVELLNQVAPAFFHMVQKLLWEETLLHIARLTDAPRTAGRENLTIRNLPELVSDPAAKRDLEMQVETALRETKFCRDWRNRLLAHCDLDLAVNEHAEPLNAASKKQVDEALVAVVRVLNLVSLHYSQSDLLFPGIHKAGGALSLLYILDKGLEAKERRKERLLRGEISGNDYPRDL